MMTRRTRFLSILTAGLVTLSLAACGGSGSTAAGSETPTADSGAADSAAADSSDAAPASGDEKIVTLFHRWPNEPKFPIFEDYVKLFEEQNPGVKIQMDCVLNDSYKEKVRVLISGNSVPDVFSCWSYSFAENLVSSGNVQGLNAMMEADPEFADSIIETQKDGFIFDGELYGIPLHMDGKVFYYNKDVFEANSLSVPATLDELYATLDTLQGAGYATPLLEGLADAWAVSHYQGTIFQRVLDPAVMDKDTNAATCEFTDAGYIEGLNIFKRLTEYMGDAAPAMDHETARNSFVAGDAPLLYAQFAEIRLVNGSASTGGDKSGAQFAYDFFNFPSVPGGKGDQTGLTGSPEGFMMSNKAQHPEEAEKLLKFLASQEAGQMMTERAGELSCIKGAVNENTANAQQIQAVELIMNATSTVPWYDNAVEASIADAFMRGGQSLAIGDMTAEEVMTEVQSVAATVRADAG